MSALKGGQATAELRDRHAKSGSWCAGTDKGRMGCPWNDKFACARYAPGPAERGIVGE
jgi:hypothetical protein